MKLSPSSIALFKRSPALWVAKHYFGIRSESGDAALRGINVENGLNAYLLSGVDVGEAACIASSTYTDEDSVEIRAYFTNGIEALSEFGPPIGGQKAVSCWINGVEVGGYIDYEYDDFCVDLKTTGKMPKVLTSKARRGELPSTKFDNVVQQAVYKLATGKDQWLAFVTPEGYYNHKVLPQEYAKAGVYLEQKVEEILHISEMDWDTMMAHTAPDLDKLSRDWFLDAGTYNKVAELYHDYL